MAIVSPAGQWLEVNKALCEMLGYSEGELRATTFQALTHPEDLEADLELLRSCLRGELKSYRIEKRYLHKQGSVVWGLLNVSAVQNERGEVQHFISQIQDITPQKVQEEEFRRQAEFRTQLIALIEASLTGAIGPAFFQRLLDMAVSAIPGAQVGSMLLRDKNQQFRFVAAQGYDLALLKTTFLLEKEVFSDGFSGPHVIHRFDNSRMPEKRLKPILEAGPSELIKAVLAIPVYLAGSPLAYIYLDNLEVQDAFSDSALEMAQLFGQQVAVVWQRLELEEELRAQRRAFEYLALHDRLTGLPNRVLLDDRLEQGIMQAKRSKKALAVLFLDLDDFKAINDRYGHKVGDEYLGAVAGRLQYSVRSGDTVARWGGDEFIILLSNLSQEEDAVFVAEKLLKSFTEPLHVNSVSLKVRASIGVALCPMHGDNATLLLQRADEAPYQAKAAGKASICVYAAR